MLLWLGCGCWARCPADCCEGIACQQPRDVAVLARQHSASPIRQIHSITDSDESANGCAAFNIGNYLHSEHPPCSPARRRATQLPHSVRGGLSAAFLLCDVRRITAACSRCCVWLSDDSGRPQSCAELFPTVRNACAAALQAAWLLSRRTQVWHSSPVTFSGRLLCSQNNPFCGSPLITYHTAPAMHRDCTCMQTEQRLSSTPTFICVTIYRLRHRPFISADCRDRAHALAGVSGVDLCHALNMYSGAVDQCVMPHSIEQHVCVQ